MGCWTHLSVFSFSPGPWPPPLAVLVELKCLHADFLCIFFFIYVIVVRGKFRLTKVIALDVEADTMQF